MAVLSLLGREEATFTEIKQFLSLADTQVSRILKVLQVSGWISGGKGEAYGLSAKSLELGRSLLGGTSWEHYLEEELHKLSVQLGTGVALFAPVGQGEGLKCLEKVDVPEAVSFIPRGEVKRDFGGHGSAVLCCAMDDKWDRTWGEGLKEDLSLTKQTWTELLNGIKRKGWYLSYGRELSLGRNSRVLKTLGRLSWPVFKGEDLHSVLCSTRHAVSEGEAYDLKSMVEMRNTAKRLGDRLGL